MVFLKSPASGIDAYIQRFQQRLHDQLLATWGLSDAQYLCYGRAYRNMRAGGYIPEVFTGGIEYKEVLMNDGVPVSSFFGLSDTEQSAGGADFVDIHLIFFVDLAVLKPTLAHRGDEEVRLDVAKAAQFNPYGFKLVSTTAGLSGIISEYPGVGDGLNFRDMHPLHCFRLNFQTQYNPLQ